MPREDTDVVQLQVRLREDLRRNLEETAQARDVSLNSVIVERLAHTRDRMTLMHEVMALGFGRDLAALLMVVGAVMRTEGEKKAGADWTTDGHAYDSAMRAAVAAMEVLRPGATVSNVDPAWARAANMVHAFTGSNTPDRIRSTITTFETKNQPRKPRSTRR